MGGSNPGNSRLWGDKRAVGESGESFFHFHDCRIETYAPALFQSFHLPRSTPSTHQPPHRPFPLPETLTPLVGGGEEHSPSVLFPGGRGPDPLDYFHPSIIHFPITLSSLSHNCSWVIIWVIL